MAGYQIKVVVGRAYVSFFMTDIKIFNYWRFGLYCDLVELFVVLDFNFCRIQLQIFEMSVKESVTHYLRFPSNNLSIDSAFFLLQISIVFVIDLVDRTNLIGL